MADDVEQEQHHQDRAQPAGGLLDRVHRIGTFRHAQHCHRTKAEAQDGPQGSAEVGGPERLGNAHFTRQVARVVGGIRREAYLPDGAQRHGGDEARQVERATAEEVGRQFLGEHHDEAGQQRRTHHPGTDTVEDVDETIADHANGGGTQRTDHDRTRHRHARGDAVDGLARQDDVGNEETDIDQRGEEHDQQGAVAAELATALHHLWNAQLRSLRRSKGNDHAPDKMAQHDGDQPP